jgi:hypothetical protein
MMLRRVTWTYPGYQILTKCIPRQIRMLKILIGMNRHMPEAAVMEMVMMVTMMRTAAEKRRIRITCKKFTIIKFPFKDSLRNIRFEY